MEPRTREEQEEAFRKFIEHVRNRLFYCPVKPDGSNLVSGFWSVCWECPQYETNWAYVPRINLREGTAQVRPCRHRYFLEDFEGENAEKENTETTTESEKEG